MKFILVLFLISLFFIPIVLSDVVEITIEYGTSTTTTVGPGVTTTATGDGGGGDVTTTVQLPGEVVKGAGLTYSMPKNYKVYQNETGFIAIRVTNVGTTKLHNIRVGIFGIPARSFSISPKSVDVLGVGGTTTFNLLIYPQNLTSKTYTITVTVASDETFKTGYSTLQVSEFTRDIEKVLEEQEEFEKEVKPTLISFEAVLIGVIVTSSIVAGIMLKRLLVKRCPLCGGEVVKEFEGENFISYKCSKCAYYTTAVKKK